jgi:regulator of protease activity HflC (stomatin/prohibitin superfamily)
VCRRLGKFSRVLEPGYNFVIPFLEAPRRILFNRTTIREDGRIEDRQESLVLIDLRESVYSFAKCLVFTSDGVQVRH